MANLSAGKSNLGCRKVNLDGVEYIEREYESGTITEEYFYESLKLVQAVGLAGDNWSMSIVEGGDIQVRNPLVKTMHTEDLSDDAGWVVYWDLLERVKALFKDHGAIIGDCHSDNLLVCELEGGEVRIQIVDGKVAGVQTDFLSVKRLYTKLWYEKDPWHRWFLRQYICYLEANGVSGTPTWAHTGGA